MRGPQVTPGYVGRPEETAALVDAGGWLRTGDLGHVDPGGDVWVVDRLKELIKVNGHQVAPAELEALLAAHPRVAPYKRLREVRTIEAVPRNPAGKILRRLVPVEDRRAR